jgi:hypothetical protein
VDLPPKSKLLGHKWIFKRNMKVDDTINRYKVTFIVKSLNNNKVLITSIQTLIVIATIKRLEIHQIDVKKKNYLKIMTFMRRFTWNNLKGLLSISKKRKFVN